MDAAYVAMLGVDRGAITAGAITAGALWGHLRDRVGDTLPVRYARATDTILKHGTLARRLIAALGPDPGRETLRVVYGELAACLAANRLFTPEG